MLFTESLLPDGRIVDFEVQNGIVVQCRETEKTSGEIRGKSGSQPTTTSLEGRLVLPAAAEPHAHLDKAFSAERVPNPSGDLMGAVKAWVDARPKMNNEDMFGRADRAVAGALVNGITAIRTHVDVGTGVGISGVEVLMEIKKKYQGKLELQVVALASPQISGEDGKGVREDLRQSLKAGADLVGGAVALDADPPSAISDCLDIAEEFEKGMDLHIDETTDAGVLTISELIRQMNERNFPWPVTASHCVSLGMQPEKIQKQIAEGMAELNINVVALPQTNLYLQARGINQSPPRGLTALAALKKAEVLIAAGGDNVQDPFNPLGRSDPMETAALMVAAGHCLPGEAYKMVSENAHSVMGLEPRGVEVGAQADFLVMEAASLREAIASAPGSRKTYVKGELTAEMSSSAEIFI